MANSPRFDPSCESECGHGRGRDRARGGVRDGDGDGASSGKTETKRERKVRKGSLRGEKAEKAHPRITFRNLRLIIVLRSGIFLVIIEGLFTPLGFEVESDSILSSDQSTILSSSKETT